MSDVRISWDNGAQQAAVSCGDLQLPRMGAWTAHLEWSGDTAPTGAVVLSWQGTDLGGYVLSSGVSERKVTALISGGAGGLWEEGRAQEYTQVSARSIVDQILADVGETLSTTATADLAALVVPKWIRRAEMAGNQLDALARSLGLTWATLPDGTIWMGTDTWADVDGFEGTITGSDPARPVVYFAPLSLAVLPGYTFDGLQIGLVVYELSRDGRMQARAWGQAEIASTTDPLRAGLDAVISQHPMVARTDYLARYPCRVVADRGGSVDLEPDLKALPPMTRVPLRVPVPGAILTVAANTRGYLGWADGDPTQPYFCDWEVGTSGKAVGRVDDVCGYLVVTTGPLGLMGASVVVSVAWSATLVPSVGLVTCTPIRITSGSPHLSLPSGSTV